MSGNAGCNKGNQPTIGLWRWLWKWFKPYRKHLVLITVFALIQVFVSPARPYIIQQIVDKAIIPGDQKLLILLTMLVIGVLVIEALVRFLFLYYARYVGQMVVWNIRQKLFQHLIKQNIVLFDKIPSGVITTRLANDSEAIRQVFSEEGLSIFADILTVFIVAGIMFWTDFHLAILTLSVVPPFLLILYFFQKYVRRVFDRIRRAITKLNVYLQERISGLLLIHSFASFDKEKRIFRSINDEILKTNVHAVRIYATFFPIVELIFAVAIAILAGHGSLAVLDGTTSPGTLVAFVLYINLMLRPLRFIADKFNTLQMGVVAGKKIYDLFHTYEKEPPDGQRHISEIKSVTFDRVWFRYPTQEKDHFALKDVSLCIEKGKQIMLIGDTGAGKTSIINLILGYYAPTKGKVLINNISVDEVNRNSIRERIGYAPQEPVIFEGSIYENITLGRDVDESWLIEQAIELNLWSLFENLPNKLKTIVNSPLELSSGQKQAISILRAWCQKPDLMIFDEATSALDVQTEQIIHSVLKSLKSKIAVIFVSHRLTFIEHMDEVYLIRKGKVIARGTPDELLAESEIYKNMLYIARAHY